MLNDVQLREIVSRVVHEVISGGSEPETAKTVSAIDEGMVPDITTVDLRKYLAVPNPENAAEYLRLKSRTPARLGVYRAGPRYKTQTLLRFRADHAVAMDAVFTDVDEDFLARNHLMEVSTLCTSRDEHLTRPDLGRRFSDETIALLKSKCVPNPQVQVYASDGLSSTAIMANLEIIMPSLEQGLKAYGLQMGTPFFVKYGRVGAMDAITEALNATVTVVLIGERPGLATGESMSAYMTYKGKVGMPEAGRTVVSNIHAHGTPTAEAGAHIAHIIDEMIKQKCSGLELKL